MYYKEHLLLIYLSRVRVPEGALKTLILQTESCGVGAFFALQKKRCSVRMRRCSEKKCNTNQYNGLKKIGSSR